MRLTGILRQSLTASITEKRQVLLQNSHWSDREPGHKNSKLKLNTNFLNHSVLNVFLKMETMQKLNNFSDPSTTYKKS